MSDIYYVNYFRSLGTGPYVHMFAYLEVIGANVWLVPKPPGDWDC